MCGWARLPGRALVTLGRGRFVRIDRHTANMFIFFRGVGQVGHMACQLLLGGIILATQQGSRINNETRIFGNVDKSLVLSTQLDSGISMCKISHWPEPGSKGTSVNPVV